MKIEHVEHTLAALAAVLLLTVSVPVVAAADREPKDAQSAEQTKQSSEKGAADSELSPTPGGEAPIEPSTSAPHNPNDPDAPVDGSHRDTGR